MEKRLTEALNDRPFMDAAKAINIEGAGSFPQQLDYWIEHGLLPQEIPKSVQHYQTMKAFWRRLLLAHMAQHQIEPAQHQAIEASAFYALLDQEALLAETARLFVLAKRQKDPNKGLETALAEEAGRFSLQRHEAKKLPISALDYYTLKQSGAWNQQVTNQLGMLTRGAGVSITPNQRSRINDKTLRTLGQFLCALDSLSFSAAQNAFLEDSPDNFSQEDFLIYLILNAQLEVFCPGINRYADRLIKGQERPDIRLSADKALYFKGTIMKVLFQTLRTMKDTHEAIGDSAVAQKKNYDQRLSQALCQQRLAYYAKNPKKYAPKGKSESSQSTWHFIESIELKTAANILNKLTPEQVQVVAHERIRAIAHGLKIPSPQTPRQGELDLRRAN